MPKRTNEFQKIIYLIQNQLASQAKVTQSKLLRDSQTKAEVEVDVVIETSLAGTNLIVGVEATAITRRATVEWVREMIGKHQHLPVNKTILVSKNGFSKEALKKAKSNKIETVTIEKAKKIDWKGVLNDLKSLLLGKFDFNIVGVSINYKPSESDGEIITLEPNLVVSQISGDKQFSLGSYVQTIVGKLEIGLEVMSKWIKLPPDKRKNNFEFNITATPESNTTLEFKKDKIVHIQQIQIKVSVDVKTAPIKMNSGRYLGEKIAFGSTKNLFSDSVNGEKDKVLISLTTKAGKLDTAVMMIPKINETETTIMPMKIVERNLGKESYKKK